MNLKQLQDTIDNINTLGFNPEDVEVKLNYTFSNLDIRSVKTVLHANKDVKPIVYVDLQVTN